MDSADTPDWLVHAFLLDKRLRLLGRTTRQAKMIGALVDLAKLASRMAYHLAEKPTRDQLSQYTRIQEEVQDGMADFEGILAGAMATFGEGATPSKAAAGCMDVDHTRVEEEDHTADYDDYNNDVSPTQIIDMRPEGMSSPAPYPLGDFDAPTISSAVPDHKPPKKLSLDAESTNRLVASLLPSLESSLVPPVAWFLRDQVLDQLVAQLPGLLLGNHTLMDALVEDIATKLNVTGPLSSSSAIPRVRTLSREAGADYGEAGGDARRWEGARELTPRCSADRTASR